MHSGIVVVNKPPQMTSQQTVTQVKRALGVKKAGHAGTLDPDAVGVLPIFLGRATRLTEYVLADEKSYQAVLVLGVSTDTQDASGKIVAAVDATAVTRQQIDTVFQQFIGMQWQTPPAYSALKISGKRAYELARKGLEVKLAPRPITIYELVVEHVTQVAQTVQVTFTVRCSKGTYIRTLCQDLGAALDLPAHMGHLMRTQTGPFHIGQAQTLEAIRERMWELVLPPEQAILHMPVISLSSDALHVVVNGQSFVSSVSKITQSAFRKLDLSPATLVRVHLETGELVAVYEIATIQADVCTLIPKKVLWQAVNE